MSADTHELLEICERLGQAERAEVADFARFLLAKHDDDLWEQAITKTAGRPKLDDFVKQALAEGSEPLDPDSI